ncbi:MAG: hypothetical protein KY456_02985 [Chloroflexi bacterium]|nr:hypothetical protein [Chloroflexota bacterium]
MSLVTITDRLALITVIITFIIAVALALAATPRRTGDAHQYIAMALQLSRLHPPSLSPAESSDYRAWLQSQPPEYGFPDGSRAVRQPALIRDDRQEFSHFWLYPLIVAPVTAVASAAGAHPLAAFSIINASLLGVALWTTVWTFGPIAALFVIASPIVWFIARAQVEIFTVALLCLAMAAASRGRWGWASLAVATAATQNAPIAAVIPLFWVAAIAEWVASRRELGFSLSPGWVDVARALGFALASAGVAALHPAYYLLRLRVLTPQELNGGIAGVWPTASVYLAPLFDPDIGFLAWMPLTAIIAAFGLGLLARSAADAGMATRRLALTALCAVGMGAWFLFLFAQTTNVNSGGTVHVSRYALWLIPLTLPGIAAASHYLDERAPGLLLGAAIVLFVGYLSYFRPDQPERYVEHSPQATWLITHVSDVYRPIPEVFVERTRHIDGGPRLSAADPLCRLVLVVAAHPEQPCALTPLEEVNLDARFAAGDTAVWVRRGTNGASAVATAITDS